MKVSDTRKLATKVPGAMAALPGAKQVIRLGNRADYALRWAQSYTAVYGPEWAFKHGKNLVMGGYFIGGFCWFMSGIYTENLGRTCSGGIGMGGALLPLVFGKGEDAVPTPASEELDAMKVSEYVGLRLRQSVSASGNMTQKAALGQCAEAAFLVAAAVQSGRVGDTLGAVCMGGGGALLMFLRNDARAWDVMARTYLSVFPAMNVGHAVEAWTKEEDPFIACSVLPYLAAETAGVMLAGNPHREEILTGNRPTSVTVSEHETRA